jgi:hypothetical protein
VVHSILLTPSAAAPLDSYDDLLTFAHRNIVPLLVGIEAR